jgi:ABC-type sugar transport system ATPase subunit
MTVRENLAFPLKNRRVAPATIRSRVGTTRPEMMLSNVDLPQPDGPSSA